MEENYNSLIEYLGSLQKTGKKDGIKNIKALLKKLGNPQEKLSYIHVVGTNGKGSTSTMVASILTTAGYKVGLFTSPYIIDFRERIQIDGEMIGVDRLHKYILQVKSQIDTLALEGIFVTYFEAVLAMALIHFREENCEVVILEAGIGGSLDATNIIPTPLVTVITKISMDHQDLLGDTIEAITKEKCGVIKTNGQVVTYPNQHIEALAVIMEQTALKGGQLHIPTEKIIEETKVTINGTTGIYMGREIKIPLLGDYQLSNATTAIKAVEILGTKGYGVSAKDIVTGIANTKIPSRLEVLSENPLVIIDGAHNEDGVVSLCRNIKKLSTGKIHIIMGIMADKDYRSAILELAQISHSFTGVNTDYYRSLSAEKIYEIAKEKSLNCHQEQDVVTAYKKISKNIAKEDMVVICGSFYLTSDFRRWYLGREENNYYI